MATLNRSKPIDQVIGASQFPGAVFHQNGAYFDKNGAFVGGEGGHSNDNDKDAEIARLSALVEALRGKPAAPPADTDADTRAEIAEPPPHGLTEAQYDELVNEGVDLRGVDEATAKNELIAYGELKGIEGLTRNMKVSTLASKILDAEGE